MSKYKQMAITDLDGTLFRSDCKISKRDIDTLELLGKENILRVIATGRSIYSVNKDIPADIPIDYLIFSTGGGILNWKTKELLVSYNLEKEQVKHVFDSFINEEFDFFIQHAIPNNHYSYYHRTKRRNPDFNKRVNIYNGFTTRLDVENFTPIRACQFIAIEELNCKSSKYELIKKNLPDYKVIRATSPIDHSSVWIEVYPKEVSKSSASVFLSERYNIPACNAFAIGNDYNDTDMLEWAENSFVVENAPKDLKKIFTVVGSNNKSGFSEAIYKWLKL